MWGLGKFLVGGLLGALFGFFVSPKRAQLVRDTLLGQKATVGPTPPRVLQTTRGVADEPESAPEPESAFEPEFAYGPEAVDASAPEWAEPEYEAPAASPPAQVGVTPVFSVSKPSLPSEAAEQHVEESEASVLEVEPLPPELGESEFWPEPEVETQAPEAVPLEVAPAPELGDVEPEPQDTGPDWAWDSASTQEPETAPVPIGLSDLKARIEETRRRIQRELDQPFATEREALDDDEAPTFGEHPAAEPEEAAATSFGFESFTESEMDQVQEAPESTAAIETYKVDEAPLEPVMAVEEQTVFEAPEEAVSEPSDEPSNIEEEPPGAPLGADSEFDHDAMRRRIEETRNRLKAKAFDAMMKGESVLLAQDADASAAETSSPAEPEPLDSEVAETIETTLSEEDI